MRLFAGTFLGPSSQRACRDCIDRLVARHAKVLRGIPDATAHLTYAFCPDLGDVPFERLVAALEPAAARLPSFEVRFARLRILPPGPRPRLVCLDIGAGAADLMRLTAGLARAASEAFPRLDFKPSRSPHVTLVRFRKHAGRSDANAVTASLQTAGEVVAGQLDRVDHVAVIESTLTPAGPVYEVRARVPLAGAPGGPA
jgi:2'-5' RNA ligase